MPETTATVKKNTAIIGAVLVAIVFFGAGYGVAHFTQAATPARSGGNFGAMGTNGARTRGAAAFAGGGAVSGELLKKDGTSMSVKTRDGSTRLILLTPSTQATKMVTGTMDDIPVGSTVMVSGTANSDGSVTAQMVQLRPQMPAGAEGPPGAVTPPAGTPAGAQPQNAPTPGGR